AGAGNMLFARPLERWRSERLDLPKRSRLPPMSALPTLYAYSPAVLPVPPEWDSNVLVSGYWFLDDGDWRPSPELAAFLAEGPAIYVGFGSMPAADPAALTQTIVDAAARSGQRIVLAAGWGRLGGRALPGNVHVID